jgi:hypothetical protein
LAEEQFFCYENGEVSDKLLSIDVVNDFTENHSLDMVNVKPSLIEFRRVTNSSL